MKFLKKHQKAVFLTLGVLFVILLWEIIAYATSQTFLKDFFLTCKESILLLGKSDTYLNLGFTLLRLLISFVISFAFEQKIKFVIFFKIDVFIDFYRFCPVEQAIISWRRHRKRL